ncbi:putative E3 ubiquitin-protein ligase dma1 [Grifola frondosa]|uniref:Putative E3 ubiquitin-protein ligase dma1 n=1 Tax=Grifola frondosa TaxID=5627 RepID=A0A1C7MNL6_GRIFR|nr:putative E3 ubiquitin-protein ligase dma1 [Grifola frondosa]
MLTDMDGKLGYQRPQRVGLAERRKTGCAEARGTSTAHDCFSPRPTKGSLTIAPFPTSRSQCPKRVSTTPIDVSGHRRRPAAAAPNLTPAISQSTSAPAFTQMLRRRRSAGAIATPVATAAVVSRTPTNPTSSHRIRLVPHLDSRRSLRFDAISRDVREGDPPLRIGRFTDRSGLGLAAANALGSNKLAFKSKVVSRAHAEIWVEAGGRFFIKDTKSSSGTFLNHIRLSAANNESRPYEIKDGDLLQLGVDYQGGAEDIYKCVKIKIETGREWQNHTNPFNANALKQLKAIAIPQPGERRSSGPSLRCQIAVSVSHSFTFALIPYSLSFHVYSSIVILFESSRLSRLFAVTIRQALFIAPCSHAFHYKCIRPLLETHHPAFSCPLCRTFADLEEDVEVEIEQDAISIAEMAGAVGIAATAVGDADGLERTGMPVRKQKWSLTRHGASDQAFAGGEYFRRHCQVPTQTAEDVDEEMEDLVMEPQADDAGSPIIVDRELLEPDHMIVMEGRDSSVSPVPVPGPAHLQGRGSPGGFSEGEASGSGEIEGLSDENGLAGDAAAHGKRKR